MNNIMQLIKSTFKQHFPKQRFNDKKRPWLLTLGPQGAGKSTFLSQIDPPLATIPQDQNAIPHHLAQWWLGQQAIFIEAQTPIDDDHNSELATPPLFSQLLKQLKHYCKQQPIDGVIIILDVATIHTFNQADRESFTDALHAQLQTLAQLQYKLPIHIIITQCDRIYGFKEFFAELNSEEKNRCFGWETNISSSETHLVNQVRKQFAQLLQSVNNRLLTTLHHTASIEKRHWIKEFPCQLAELQQQLLRFIKYLPWHTSSALQGIYFISCEQKNTLIDITPLSAEWTLPLPSHQPPPTHQQTFFTQLLTKHIITRIQQVRQQKELLPWGRMLALPVALAIIVTSTLFWHNAYQANLAALENAQTILTQKPVNGVALLNQLQKVKQSFNTSTLQHYQWSGLSQALSLKKTIGHIYRQHLSMQLQPDMLQLLTHTLKNGVTGNKLALYNALKIYLMLTQPKHFNANTIIDWFQAQWQKQYPNDTQLQKTLTQYLVELLKQPDLRWPISKKLITKARATLTKLPLADLAFLELKSMYSAKQISILPSGKAIPGVNLQQATVPAFYNAKNFNTIYNNDIPNIDRILAGGSWVLGTTAHTNLPTSQKKALIRQVRNLYLSFYSQQWLSIISQIQLAQPRNLKELQTMISLLSDPGSPLLKLLKIITGNALLSSQDQLTSTPKNQTFLTIDAFINSKPPYQHTQAELQKLGQYLQGIYSLPNRNKATYNAAAERFQKQNKKDPLTAIFTAATIKRTPVQAWLNTIAQKSWGLLLAGAKQYLNAVWKTTVLPECHNDINNRFPIFAQSKKDIPQKSFQQFFGPKGTLANFFNNYLLPFVNTDQRYWTWNKLNGQTIPIAQTTLNMLLRASLIQQMFYTDDFNQPSMKFVLKPIALSTNTQSFTINIGGQMLELSKSSNNSASFTWPGPSPGFVTMRFNAKTGQKPTITTTGIWAWLKILHSYATVTPTTNAKIFHVTLKSGNYSAQFELIADNLINPYLPNILRSFRCPESL